MEKVALPTQRIKAEQTNPKRLVIYSKPKTGKTSLMAALDNNLILDFENGSGYVDALKLDVKSLADLRAIGSQIIEEGRPYKYITVDTVTALEDMVRDLALKMYKETPMGAKFPGNNVLTLPNGAGYLYLREAFFSVLNYIDTLAPHIILLGHLKDKQVELKGKEVNSADVDLTGKIKTLVCSKADAIGYIWREADGENWISFKSSDQITCGARPVHLKNQEFLISKLNLENGQLETYWDKIFKQ